MSLCHTQKCAAQSKPYKRNTTKAIRSGFVDFDTEYPKAVEALKNAGIDEYIADLQRQVDEFLAA